MLGILRTYADQEMSIILKTLCSKYLNNVNAIYGNYELRLHFVRNHLGTKYRNREHHVGKFHLILVIQ